MGNSFILYRYLCYRCSTETAVAFMFSCLDKRMDKAFFFFFFVANTSYTKNPFLLEGCQVVALGTTHYSAAARLQQYFKCILGAVPRFDADLTKFTRQ